MPWLQGGRDICFFERCFQIPNKLAFRDWCVMLASQGTLLNAAKVMITCLQELCFHTAKEWSLASQSCVPIRPKVHKIPSTLVWRHSWEWCVMLASAPSCTTATYTNLRWSLAFKALPTFRLKEGQPPPWSLRLYFLVRLQNLHVWIRCIVNVMQCMKFNV